MPMDNVERQSSATFSLCKLCYEESASASSSVVLSNCHHHSCKSCLVKWIEKAESSGKTTPPTCPFCRLAINEDDVFAILGRSFQPRQRATKETHFEDEIDDLTLEWLNEHTVLCQGCGSHVEKESGCDLIECLCGWRFCYSCGLPGGVCGCNPGHGFLGNYDFDFGVTFWNTIEDLEIDLAYVEETEEGEEKIHRMVENMPPFEEMLIHTFDGHVFRAFISGTDTVVSEFVMRYQDHNRYTIVKCDCNHVTFDHEIEDLEIEKEAKMNYWGILRRSLRSSFKNIITFLIKLPLY